MKDERDPFDGDYIGNIFGPKLTRYGLIFILFFLALALYRHWSLGVGPGWVLEEEAIDTKPEADTLQLENKED